MAGHRFDALTRALAWGLPRRGALRILAGLALSGSAARVGGVAAKDKKKRKDKDDCEHFEGVCNSRGECCTEKGFVCINRVCLNCVGANDTCNPNAQWGDECCNGLKCDSGELKCVEDDSVECEGQGCGKNKKKKKGKGKKKGKKHGGNPGGGSSGGCLGHLDCGAFERCAGGQCVPVECIGDGDCPDGQFCLSDFTCFDPSNP